MKDNLILALLGVFVPVSLLTIGGGSSALSEIHRQVVLVQAWLDEDTFTNLFALSRIAPGPGSLLVTLIGWQIAGWAGALVASVAVFVPSSLVMYALARLWTRHRGARWQRAVERGLTPIAAGLILAATFTLLRAAQGGPVAWAVAAASTLALSTTRLSPVVALGGGAAVFLARHLL